MKTYLFLFILLTFAEIVFTAVYFLLVKKLDAVVLLGVAVYIGGMFIAYIAYEVEKYRKRKKEFIDSLP